MTSAIFRHVSNAMRDRFLRRGTECDRVCPLSLNFARIGRRKAKKNSRQFRAARAHQAGEAKDLSCANFQASHCLLAAGRATNVLQCEHHVARRAFRRRINMRNFAAHHQFDQRGFIDFAELAACRRFRRRAERSRDRRVENFLEAVRNINDAHAAVRRS